MPVNKFLRSSRENSEIQNSEETSEKDELKQCPFRWVSGVGKISKADHRLRNEAIKCQLF